MIGYYKISAIGTDHLEKPGGVCQDYCDVLQLENGYTIAVIADGLGSASRSDVGAKLAVDSVIGYLRDKLLPQKDDEYYIHLLLNSYKVAYNSIIGCAEENGTKSSEYNTTLAAALYDGKTVYYGQCGDGGIIVLTSQGDFDCATTVKKGENFNETYPLLGGEQNWSFGKYSGDVCALTMMTDGIFDIVCHPLLARQEQKINIPFIRRFMDRNILKANDADDFSKLRTAISSFVSGNGLPGVTDDKTIVGLINTEVTAALKKDSYYAEPDWNALREKMNDILRSPTAAEAVSVISEEKSDDADAFQDDQTEISPDDTETLSDSGTSESDKVHTVINAIIIAEAITILLLLIIVIVMLIGKGKDSEKDSSNDITSASSSTDESSIDVKFDYKPDYFEDNRPTDGSIEVMPLLNGYAYIGLREES